MEYHSVNLNLIVFKNKGDFMGFSLELF